MAQFTEHAGDPAWLKSQRASADRAKRAPRQAKAMPYPTATKASPPPSVGNASTTQFVQGAKNDSQLGAFIMGAVFGAVLRGRR